MQKRILITVITVMLILLSACTSKEAKSVIEKIDNIGEISVDTGKKLEEIETEYEALSEEDKAQVENYKQYEDAVKEFHAHMYGLIKKELETTQKLKVNYFAQYYDLKKVESTKFEAEEIISNSLEEKYEIVYQDLKTENDSLQTYIDNEYEKIFNMQTSEEMGYAYPFAVDETHLPEFWSLKPIVKQSSSHPTWIHKGESEVTDKPPYVSLFINGSSQQYDYKTENIETKKINVQNVNGEIKTALVNTEIVFKQQNRHPVNMDENTLLNERPAYLLVDKGTSNIYIALQNYDGEDYYVLYAFYE